MLSKSQVKYIQSLGQKKFRDESGLFVAETPKILDDLLRDCPAQIVDVFALPGWIDAHPAIQSTFHVTEIAESDLSKISSLTTPNEVLAVVKKMVGDREVSAKGSLLIALDKIQDPGNLGTIIRIADWFGLSQIVCSPDSADCYSPKAVQSTMGSIARVSVSYTDLPAWFARQKDSRVFAASLEGRDVAQVAKISEGILVIGNESKGISEAVMDYCNVRINIPRRGKAESLNAAVATGIILSHLI